MKKHKCKIDEDEVGIIVATGEKQYFCPICQKQIMSVKVKK
jgi:hypothetical protein